MFWHLRLALFAPAHELPDLAPHLTIACVARISQLPGTYWPTDNDLAYVVLTCCLPNGSAYHPST